MSYRKDQPFALLAALLLLLLFFFIEAKYK
jgi:Flp pilus assembly protein TadG